MSATIIKSQVVRELASIVVAMAAISGGRGSLGFTQFSGRNGSNACPWIVAKIAAQHLQGNRSVRSLCDAALLRKIFDESNRICDSKGGRDACAKTVTMDLFAAKSLLPIVVNDVICLTRQDLVRHMCREVPPWVLIVIGQKRSSCGELEVNFNGIHDTFIIAASVCDVGSIDSHSGWFAVFDGADVRSRELLADFIFRQDSEGLLYHRDCVAIDSAFVLHRHGIPIGAHAQVMAALSQIPGCKQEYLLAFSRLGTLVMGRWSDRLDEMGDVRESGRAFTILRKHAEQISIQHEVPPWLLPSLWVLLHHFPNENREVI